ncbi:MAG: ABC transporter ATP-binding protein [Chloroflexi bacterium]|nr:ABC transporter ATP-binding protein [Chloroflexota bacterium]
MRDPILRIEDLHIEFRTSRGVIHALQGVTFDVMPGEIFGVVGETGCGKTITGLSVLRLLPRSARITQGNIRFEGVDLLKISQREMRSIRGGKISIIFQDPSTSMNPLFTIGFQMNKVIREHLKFSREKARERALTMLAATGLPDVERIYDSYPHQLSGGMLQRAMIALALSCEHSLLIADEPTTALDVTIQSQILQLMRELQQKLGVAMILITHNLGVVANMCDRLVVLYAGRVVEIGESRSIFENPQHPYTRGLMSAIPAPGSRGNRLSAIPGNVPIDPGALKGCVFAPRCAFVMPRCLKESPVMFHLSKDHASTCFLAERGDLF